MSVIAGGEDGWLPVSLGKEGMLAPSSPALSNKSISVKSAVGRLVEKDVSGVLSG